MCFTNPPFILLFLIDFLFMLPYSFLCCQNTLTCPYFSLTLINLLSRSFLFIVLTNFPREPLFFHSFLNLSSPPSSLLSSSTSTSSSYSFYSSPSSLFSSLLSSLLSSSTFTSMSHSFYLSLTSPLHSPPYSCVYEREILCIRRILHTPVCEVSSGGISKERNHPKGPNH